MIRFIIDVIQAKDTNGEQGVDVNMTGRPFPAESTPTDHESAYAKIFARKLNTADEETAKELGAHRSATTTPWTLITRKRDP